MSRWWSLLELASLSGTGTVVACPYSGSVSVSHEHSRRRWLV
jgi:hypothetical protein